MGNQQPKQSQQGLHSHQRLGPVRIYQQHDKQTQQMISFMEITKLIESQRVIQHWKEQRMRIQDSQSRQILLLPLSYQFYKSGMCGSNGTLIIKYQNLSYVLKGEIQNRYKINRYFQQRQIWYLLYNMIRAGNKFERIKRKVGNMHPNNILINDDGQIKIISTCSIPGQVDNFQLMTQNHDAYAFLAPQQLANDAVQNAKYPTGINPCLAEIFSIGLTILSAGTLLECDNVYERKKQSIKINQNQLQNLLRNFKQTYSLFLSDIVSDMLAISPNNRKSSSQIYQMLYKYQNQILDLEPFAPPQRYIIPQTQIRSSNVYTPTNYHNQPPITSSQAFGSNVYTRPVQQVHTVVPAVLINDSHLHRSNMPVQQVITSSQIPNNVRPGQNSGYSSQYRQVITPNVQQSGIYAQRQSYAVPGTSSSVMTSSFYPPQQVQLPTSGSNVIVTQSNYLPNYQYRQ